MQTLRLQKVFLANLRVTFILLIGLFPLNGIIRLDVPQVSVSDFQVFPNTALDSGPYLPEGDRVSWGYVATGLVWGNGTSRAWRFSDMGEGVRVAVLDTGVDLTLPDLSGRIAAYRDFTREGFFDGHGHGTATAAILGANLDGRGIAGVAPMSLIVAGKVLDTTGSGTDLSTARGIEWAMRQRVRIISMSLGHPGPCSDLPLTSRAIGRALKAGILIVASAGNGGQPSSLSGLSTVSCPASYPGVIAVSSSGAAKFFTPNPDGSVDQSTRVLTEISGFSSRGPEVSLAAPGRHIITWFRSSMMTVSGTSVAVPQVAGLFALMINRYGDYASIISRLPQIGRNEFSFKGAIDAFYGHGLINATDALTPQGDVNGDLAVDDIDTGIVHSLQDCRKDDPCWKPAADQDWDGDIDIDDLLIAGVSMGSVLTPKNTSVWNTYYVGFSQISIFADFDEFVRRYAFSKSLDSLDFALTYTNTDVWKYLSQEETSLVLVVRYGLFSSIGIDLLKTPSLTFQADGVWFYEIRLRTRATAAINLPIAAWKITTSSSFGYSYEIPVLVSSLLLPPAG